MGIIIIAGLLVFGTILFFCFAKPRDQTPISYEEQQHRVDEFDEKNSDNEDAANWGLFCVNPIVGIIKMAFKSRKDKQRRERK